MNTKISARCMREVRAAVRDTIRLEKVYYRGYPLPLSGKREAAVIAIRKLHLKGIMRVLVENVVKTAERKIPEFAKIPREHLYWDSTASISEYMASYRRPPVLDINPEVCFHQLNRPETWVPPALRLDTGALSQLTGDTKLRLAIPRELYGSRGHEKDYPFNVRVDMSDIAGSLSAPPELAGQVEAFMKWVALHSLAVEFPSRFRDAVSGIKSVGHLLVAFPELVPYLPPDLMKRHSENYRNGSKPERWSIPDWAPDPGLRDALATVNRMISRAREEGPDEQ